MHVGQMHGKGAAYLLESSWKTRYGERRVRRMLERHAGMTELERRYT